MYFSYDEYDYASIEDLEGKVLAKVIEEDESITFETADGDTYVMYHDQDCCESVTVEDVAGEFVDLIGEPILMAEEVTETGEHSDWGDTFTWTFYKLATMFGYVTIRWYGSSNGYYSESVDFVKLTKNNER